MDFEQHEAKVRITRSSPQDGYKMLAYRVVNTPPFARVRDSRSGVLFLSTPQGEHTVPLTTTPSTGDALVPLDLELIKSAIANNNASDRSQVDTLVGRLQWAFDRNGRSR